MDTKSTAEHGGEPSSWDKVKVSSDTQSGWDTAGWGIADSSTKNAMDGWNNPNSFGGDLASNEDIGKLNQKNSWDKPSNFEGGRGFGRGRGREDGWDKPSNFQGSGWGRGSDGNSEGREDGWNRQTDFDRGRGSNRGRGRVRFGGRGFGDEDNQDNQGGYRGGWGSGGGRGGRGRFGGRGSGDEDNQDNQGGFGCGWGSGRGRGGRGRYGGRGSGDEDNQDSQEGLVGGWSSGRGRGGRGCNEDSVNFTDNFGCGRGRSRGRFQSSDWNNDQDNFGDRNFSADPSSSWGNQRSSWNKSKEESGHIEQSDVWDGWSSKQSSHGKKDEGSNKWDAPGKADGDSLPSKRNQGSSTNAGGGDYWNATSKIKGNNWNTHKASCSAGDFASWEKVSAGKEATGVGGGWGISKQSAGNVLSSWAQDKAGARDNNWDSEKPQNAQQSSGWHDARKEWTKSNSCGESGNSDITLEDNWNKAKLSSDEVSAKESNWDSPKSWVGKRPSDWNQSSTASELGKELGSNSGDNWSKPKPFYHGNESSKWGNDNSGDWSKPKSSSWNDSSSGFKDGDRDQSGEGWNCGSNGGRGDSFSGRGRGFCGRGRNFHGGRSSDWSGGRSTNREDQSEIFSRPKTFGGQSSNWNDEGFTSGNKSDWNAKENAAEKGSWDNWNAKKVSDGNESKTSGWNSPSLSMKEGEQKDGVFGTGSSSKGEQGGGWGGGSFNKGKFASNWNNDGSSAKNGDDVWVSKSTAQNQPQASGWNNQKQSDDGGEGNWGKAKGNNGGIWEW